jgi:hypothetical protein
VTFPTNVDNCGAVASIGFGVAETAVGLDALSPTVVSVQTFLLDGRAADLSFHLIVVC